MSEFPLSFFLTIVCKMHHLTIFILYLMVLSLSLVCTIDNLPSLYSKYRYPNVSEMIAPEKNSSANISMPIIAILFSDELTFFQLGNTRKRKLRVSNTCLNTDAINRPRPAKNNNKEGTRCGLINSHSKKVVSSCIVLFFQSL